MTKIIKLNEFEDVNENLTMGEVLFGKVLPFLGEGFIKTLPAEDVFAGQVVQLSVPVVALNFPAEHAEHVPPSAMNPALH